MNSRREHGCARDITKPGVRRLAVQSAVFLWLRGPLWPIVAEFILGPWALGRGLFEPSTLRRLAEEHRSGQVEHRCRLWLLLNLEIWQRVFVDRDDAAAIMKAA